MKTSGLVVGCAVMLVWMLGAGVAMAQDAELQRGPAAAEARHEDTSAETRTFRLWEGKAPGAMGDAEEDRPSLTWYAPFDAKGPTPAVIVMPGGGYAWLATNHEGRQIANWFNAMGI